MLLYIQTMQAHKKQALLEEMKMNLLQYHLHMIYDCHKVINTEEQE